MEHCLLIEQNYSAVALEKFDRVPLNASLVFIVFLEDL